LKRIGNPNPVFETKHKDRNSDLRVLQKKDSLEAHQAKDIFIWHNYNIHLHFFQEKGKELFLLQARSSIK
jgi:hypothetical protein